jgi:crotonobetainyl-CoA:carnitine CoA-transferase CaiB-like acyl-CoA transferase
MPDSGRESQASPAAGALDGVVVLELGSRIGAGVCGSLLAQLGATVVVVEPPASRRVAGKWHHRPQFTAGKLSVCVDPDKPTDRDLLGSVLAGCDALIVSSDMDGGGENALPAGIEADKVVCDVTAYGRDGPRAGQAHSEWQIQALAGIVETTGMADGAPVPIPLPIVEFMTGVYAAAATIAALRVRHACGVGQAIDMALYDCAFSAMATFLPRPLAGSKEPIRRAGNRHAMIAPWNVYKARDGWILICVGSDAQWQRLCEITERPDLRAAAQLARMPGRLARAGEIDAELQAWVSRHSIEECVAALNEGEIACGPIVRIDGHPREANLEHRGMICQLHDPLSRGDVMLPGSPLRMGASAGLAPQRVPAPDADREHVRRLAAKGRHPAAWQAARRQPKAALEGIRIVEIGHYTTAPLSTRMLASLGAEVVKIEPPEGEATRAWPPAQRGQGYFFTYTNTDKKSLVLDLRKDADAGVLRTLIAGADVLIENLKPGALARRGFSPEGVAALNPRLVYCSISGFGAHSLYVGRPAYDSVVQAMSGLMDVVRSEGVPVKCGISSADLMGAEMGVLAVLAALAYRDRTGRGQYVDLSMQDITAWLTQTAWGKARHSPVSLIACRDGHVVAEMETARSAELARRALGGEPASARDLPRDEAVARLVDCGVRAAPVRSVHEMLAEPQTAARRLWFSTTAGGETWPLLASPLRLMGTPPAVHKPMPALGHDTATILEALQVASPEQACLDQLP